MAVVFEGKGAYTSGSGSLRVPMPANVAQGDLLVLIAEGESSTPLTPFGWTNIGSYNNHLTTYINVVYKIAGASEGNVTVLDSGLGTRAIVLRFTGHDPNIPINGTPRTGEDTSPTSMSFDGITTTVANCMVVCAVGFNDLGASANTSNYSNWSCAALNSITEDHDQFDTSGKTGGGIAFAYGIKATAGATNAITVTADSNNNESVYVVFGIAPFVINYNTSINIGGTWKLANGVWVNVGGTWKAISGLVKANIGGTWK